MSEFLDITHSRHSSFLAPCLGRGTHLERLALVAQFLGWHATVEPVPLSELEQTFGIVNFGQIAGRLIVPKVIADAPSTRAEPAGRSEIMKALDEEIAEDGGAELEQLTGSRRSGKLARMLLSESKPDARLGATSEARRIYRDLPAASDDVDDDKRIRQFNACFHLAAATFDPALAKPIDPIAALNRQATLPARFTPEQIDAMVAAMPAILARAGIVLKHNTVRGFVIIGGLTIRKNIHLHENRIGQ
jgi:hypothetical protein